MLTGNSCIAFVASITRVVRIKAHSLHIQANSSTRPAYIANCSLTLLENDAFHHHPLAVDWRLVRRHRRSPRHTKRHHSSRGRPCYRSHPANLQRLRSAAELRIHVLPARTLDKRRSTIQRILWLLLREQNSHGAAVSRAVLWLWLPCRMQDSILGRESRCTRGILWYAGWTALHWVPVVRQGAGK